MTTQTTSTYKKKVNKEAVSRYNRAAYLKRKAIDEEVRKMALEKGVRNASSLRKDYTPWRELEAQHREWVDKHIPSPDGKVPEAVIWIPASISIDKIMDEMEEEGIRMRPHSRDCVMYVLGFIGNQTLSATKVGFDLVDPVSISTALFMKMNRFLYDTLTWLVERGYVHSDKLYIPSVKCQYYRFSEKYANETPKYTTFDPRYIERVSEKLLSERVGQGFNMGLREQFPKMVNYIKSMRIKDKSATAVNILLNGNLDEDGKLKNANNKLISNQVSIEMLSRGDIHHTVDEFSGRLHTNITNISSSLRPFMAFSTVKSENDLCNVDVKNSQVMGLAALMGDFLMGGRLDELGLSDEITSKKLREYAAGSDRGSRESFRVDAQKGAIYDRILSEIIENPLWHGSWEHFLNAKEARMGFKPTRKSVKWAFLTMLFAPVTDSAWKSPQVRTVRRVLRSIYPGASRFLNNIKYDSTISDNALARLLQRMEVKHMLHHVCGKLVRGFERSMDILTIHDSLVCRLSDAKTIEMTIKDSYMELYNLHVTVSTEPFQNKKADVEYDIQVKTGLRLSLDNIDLHVDYAVAGMYDRLPKHYGEAEIKFLKNMSASVEVMHRYMERSYGTMRLRFNTRRHVTSDGRFRRSLKKPVLCLEPALY